MHRTGLTRRLLHLSIVLVFAACSDAGRTVHVVAPDEPVSGLWQVTATATSDSCGLLRDAPGGVSPFMPLGDFLDIRSEGASLTITHAIYCSNFCPWGTGSVAGAVVTLSSRRIGSHGEACTLEIHEADVGTREGDTITGEFTITATPMAGCEFVNPCTIGGTFTARRCGPEPCLLRDCFRECSW
jgi:hypothetical protein